MDSGRTCRDTRLLAQINDLRNDNERLKLEITGLRKSAPPDAENYVGGDDLFTVRGSFTYWDSGTCSDTWKVKKSWDEIFSIAGPLMYDEADEERLFNILGRLVEFDKATSGRDHLSVRIDRDLFQTIKIQL